MPNLTLEPLVLGGIITVFLLIVGSRAANTLGSPGTSKGASDPIHPEVPRPGPLDWDREPPSVRRPGDPNTDSQATQAQDGTADSEPSSEAEPSDFEFGWQFDANISFDDVGGMKHLKEELRRDLIYPLQAESDLIEVMGLSPDNVLFHGPPGTGKTYMARALAGELGVPFVALSGPTLQSKWINESAMKVQTLFFGYGGGDG